jgi:TetR/AcrR family transcriptional regulator, cholesterol catabolism regulator
MPEIEEIKPKIVSGAMELFMKYGIRSVTMDDIARHLGMSKKTIYQGFADKDEIVQEVTKMHQCMWEEKSNHFAHVSANAIEELVRFSVLFRDHMKQMNPSLMFDLVKYHREAWQDWLNYKAKIIKQKIIDTLNRGITEGYFRKDLNVDILATFRLEQIEMAFNDTVFPYHQYNFEEVQMQLFDHFIYGCLTRQGVELYEETKRKIFDVELTPIPVK